MFQVLPWTAKTKGLERNGCRFASGSMVSWPVIQGCWVATGDLKASASSRQFCPHRAGPSIAIELRSFRAQS